MKREKRGIKKKKKEKRNGSLPRAFDRRELSRSRLVTSVGDRIFRGATWKDNIVIHLDALEPSLPIIDWAGGGDDCLRAVS